MEQKLRTPERRRRYLRRQASAKRNLRSLSRGARPFGLDELATVQLHIKSDRLLGPATLTSGVTCSTNCWKLFLKRPASRKAALQYCAGSFQDFSGTRISS